MTENNKTFNAENYKQTTRIQWNDAAEAWHRWGGLLSKWLGASTQTMFDMCDIKEGSRVLDVAAGAGDQSVAAAKRVGPKGYVLATDLSPKILEFAKSEASLSGINHLDVRVIDGENLSEMKSDELFDSVISRVGLIYFPDQQKALRGMRDQLKEGGKIAAMVYSTADKNGFFSLPVSIIRKRANLPSPLPGQPGPFSLGKKEVLEKAFKGAGFKDVKVVAIDAPVRLPSASECLQFEQESFGALHQLLSSVSDIEKDDIWLEIENELKQFEQDGQFIGPCEVLVAVGTK